MDSRLTVLRRLSEKDHHQWSDRILKVSEQKDEAAKEELIDELIKCKEQTLFALSESNSKIETFFTTDEAFNKKLIELKIANGCPKMFFKSLEAGKEQVSPFQTYMGLYLWKQYREFKDLSCLEKACDFKEYHAIRELIVFYQKQLVDLISSPLDEDELREEEGISRIAQRIQEEGTKIAQKIYKLTLILCDIYHALGCANAAEFLTQLAELYSTLPKESELLKQHKTSEFLQLILQTMAEDLFLAIRFEHLPTSEQLAKDIMREKYVYGIFHGIEQWIELDSHEKDSSQTHPERKHVNLELKEAKTAVEKFLKQFEITDTLGFFKKVEDEIEEISQKVPEYKKTVSKS